MATTVTVYKSTDTGAPTLLGTKAPNQDPTTGLINVLDKCLVTGYGTKVAAGWTKPFTSTYNAAFRPAGGNRFYWQVYEDASGTAAMLCHFFGFETMTAISTGTGPFPTAVAYYTLPLTDTSGLARPWIVVADDRTVYLFADPANNMYYAGISFGDVFSYVPSDGYRTGMFGGSDGAVNTSGLGQLVTSIASASQAHVMARSYTGLGGALDVGVHGDVIKQDGTFPCGGKLPYPNPSDSKIWLSPIYIHQIADPTPRGKMRGFWQWLHPQAAIADQDTFPGAGDLTGKTFLAIKNAGSITNTYGTYIIETSSTWDTN